MADTRWCSPTTSRDSTGEQVISIGKAHTSIPRLPRFVDAC
jgi:hypothetical protein